VALRKFLTVLRRRLRIVVAVFLLCVVGTTIATSLATRTYTATAGVYFTVRTAESVSALAEGATFSQAQLASFATLAVTPTVLEPVAEKLGLPGGAGALSDQLAVTALSGTTVLDLSVTDTDPRQAARIANAVAAQVITVVQDLAPRNPASQDSSIKATVVTPATVPHSASAPNSTLDLTAAVVLGLGLGVLLAFAREAMDTRVRTAEDLAQLTTRPLLGSLAVSGRHEGLVVVAAPHSPQAEAYRQLRTNLQFLQVGGAAADDAPGGRVLTVSSSVAGEGKSTTAANLAVALAETSARVLLVDADLRRPALAGLLGLEGAAGLTTVLLGQAERGDVVQEWGTAGLQVLPSGPLPPNPTELLGSPAMGRLLEELRAEYDYVVLDSAPLLPVADGAVLAAQADGTVLLANVTRVRRHQVTEALGTLGRVDATVLGLVLNQVPRDEHTYGYAAEDAQPPAGTPTARFGRRRTAAKSAAKSALQAPGKAAGEPSGEGSRPEPSRPVRPAVPVARGR
jgi:capsular exopolysaccharide synthesis family protein